MWFCKDQGKGTRNRDPPDIANTSTRPTIYPRTTAISPDMSWLSLVLRPLSSALFHLCRSSNTNSCMLRHSSSTRLKILSSTFSPEFHASLSVLTPIFHTGEISEFPESLNCGRFLFGREDPVLSIRGGIVLKVIGISIMPSLSPTQFPCLKQQRLTPHTASQVRAWSDIYGACESNQQEFIIDYEFAKEAWPLGIVCCLCMSPMMLPPYSVYMLSGIRSSRGRMRRCPAILLG